MQCGKFSKMVLTHCGLLDQKCIRNPLIGWYDVFGTLLATTGLWLKVVQASTTVNKFQVCRHIGEFVQQWCTDYCRRFLHHCLYHWKALNDGPGETHWLHHRQDSIADWRTCSYVSQLQFNKACHLSWKDIGKAMESKQWMKKAQKGQNVASIAALKLLAIWETFDVLNWFISGPNCCLPNSLLSHVSYVPCVTIWLPPPSIFACVFPPISPSNCVWTK